ncbi:MAG: hypothetical protein KY455_06925 [Euryarchaeota archaeon]|nr:hypothetical protein [Euryarchaeota archaeon]
MRKTTLMLIGAAALLALASPVSAHDFAVPVGDDTYYVYPHPDHYDPTTGEAPQVWKETNGLAGLQEEEVTVDGVTYVPDQRVA